MASKLFDSDIANDRVIVNWWVTTLVMAAALIAFGAWTGASPFTPR